MRCIVCNNKIEEILITEYIFYSGVVTVISPSYGSCHDLRMMKIGICDVCLTKSEKRKVIEILEE